MKVSIQEDAMTVIGIYTPHNRWSKIENKNLTELKGESDSSAVVHGVAKNQTQLRD